MIGNDDDIEDTGLDETVEEEELDEDAMPDIEDDTVNDLTGELRVDALVAKVGGSDPDEAARRRMARKRLEDLEEQRNAKLDDTFNFNLDDEL